MTTDPTPQEASLASRANGVPRTDRADRVAVIGAGTSGLAMARRLKQAGIAFDCLEREDDLGGNWNYGKPHSSVFASTHTVSSKRLTEYLDFPMPETWPEFPSHRLVLRYLRDYAAHFDLEPHIEYGAGVERLDPRGDQGGGWVVEMQSGERRVYGRVAIANGHNWDPSWPSWSGRAGSGETPFLGAELHSSEYKTPDTLAGKRVLVVGCGNSGCDIAVESSQHAERTRVSLRRGYHIFPKFFHGTPIDICGERLLNWRVPTPIRRVLTHGMNFFLQGTRAGTGLPKPDHKLFESHPLVSSQLVYMLRHGDLEIRPDVERLTPEGVRYVDGQEEAFDTIIHATGFRLSFPFIDLEQLNWHGDERTGRPVMHLNVFHPERDDLFVLGMIQPDSGQWGLVDRQARLVCQYLLAKDHGARGASRFDEQRSQPDLRQPLRFVDSPRHRLEVEHHSYRRRLDREWRRLRRGAPRPSTNGGLQRR